MRNKKATEKEALLFDAWKYIKKGQRFNKTLVEVQKKEKKDNEIKRD